LRSSPSLVSAHTGPAGSGSSTPLSRGRSREGRVHLPAPMPRFIFLCGAARLERGASRVTLPSCASHGRAGNSVRCQESTTQMPPLVHRWGAYTRMRTKSALLGPPDRITPSKHDRSPRPWEHIPAPVLPIPHRAAAEFRDNPRIAHPHKPSRQGFRQLSQYP
jgi:hypothetical protein